MMHLLDLLTILCAGLMIGNELTVSLFINPVLWRLDEPSQMKALSLFARILGKVMPFWYGLCLLLFGAEAYLRHHDPSLDLLVAAIVIWVGVILFTIASLLPINNRIAQLSTGSYYEGWQQEHKRWDRLHRWRIALLLAAMVCVLWSILQGR